MSGQSMPWLFDFATPDGRLLNEQALREGWTWAQYCDAVRATPEYAQGFPAFAWPDLPPETRGTRLRRWLIERLGGELT